MQQIMDKGIKNLIVDFGGVLIDLNRSCCIESFKSLGISNIEELINPYFQKGVFLELEKGEITSAEFRNAIRKFTARELRDEQIDAAWNSFLINIPLYKLELLLKLRQSYKLYLLSNTNDIHWKWACRNCFSHKGLGVGDYFEQIFLSYDLHQVKPDKEIFLTLFEKTGISPRETLFIDDASANCITAQELGIRTYMPSPEEDWSHLFD